jgi:FkbH-like protein
VTDQLYSRLAWLPAAPADFAAACKTLGAASPVGTAARDLAQHALDLNQLTRLGKAMMRVASQGGDLRPLEPMRLGLLGNGTLDWLIPALVASGARYGFALECVPAPYGQIMQAALDPSSRLLTAKLDAILLAIDHRGLPLQFIAGDPGAERADIDGALAQLNLIRDSIRLHSQTTVIVQTIPPPPESLFGSFDCMVPGTPRHAIERLNRAIVDSIANTNDLVLDVASLAETVGLGTWHSPALWNQARLPCDESCLPLYAEHVVRLLGAARGRSRKCLILDLDNTVWGGVIGDDGLEGIQIAQGDATGEAYRAVQQLALNLRRRGVILAVSSKNIDKVARAPFRDHPEMVLKEEHFAVFQANWNDKATNIKAIAEELALGLDAMVFLDDNPMERDRVRRALPQVAVPELPEDPAWYARTLAAAGYFESVAFSAEDRARAGMYESNARRVALRSQSGDLDAYLASLDMEIQFAPFDALGRARIAQLINKSNQFNLTARRYTEAEISAAEEDPDVFTLQVRLLDRFGDNGMISVVICRPEGADVWSIDTWLMSCRVLGRKVEQMVLREIAIRAKAAGIRTLVGTYRPTEKNALVRDHYPKLGFTNLEQRADGTTVWSLGTEDEIPSATMTVRRAGFDIAQTSV